MDKVAILNNIFSDYYENYAGTNATIILESNSFSALFELICDLNINPQSCQYLKPYKSKLERARFRSAYILEYAYFMNRELLLSNRERFFNLFAQITNESAKRHFSKIAADMISRDRSIIDESSSQVVATACVDWIMNRDTKVAVKVWAVETILLLRDKVEWLDQVLDDVYEELTSNPTPGMITRLRGWKNHFSK